MQIERDVIMRAKEKLGDENVRIIVEELGITDYDERDMKCCCPFHAENHASFIYFKIIYVFLTIFLYLLKCPQSLIL